MKAIYALALAGFPVAAYSQGNCASHGAIVEQLAVKYGESRQIVALAADNTVMELFASASGIWTITVTQAGGLTCLVAAGQHYDHVAEALPTEGVDG